MTLNITIGPSSHASDVEKSSESEAEVAPPSSTRSHEYHEPDKEWAWLTSPDELEPSDSANRPRRRGRRRSRYREAAPFPSAMSRQDDWLISSGDNDKDITTHLNLDVALDVEDDLGHLAHLNRLGHFRKGIRYFEERLAPHVDFFPVVAEYADLLLEQGNFGGLHQFISSRLTDPLVEYSNEEYILLKTIKAFAEIYTRGALIPALKMTTEALNHHLMKPQDPRATTPLPGQKIQLIEVCVRIIAYANAHSDFLETEPFQPLLHWSISDDGSVRIKDHRIKITRLLGSRGPRVGAWYRLLLQEGFSWDAHRILRSILPMLGDQDGHYIPNRGFEEFAQLKDISGAGDAFRRPQEVRQDNEQLLLTDFANASLLADFFNVERPAEAVRIVYSHFSKRSNSLASTMLLEYPHLINTRSYLDWLLLESTRDLPASCRLQMPVQQPRADSEMRTCNIIDKVRLLHERKPFLAKRTELPRGIKNPSLFGDLGILSESIKSLGDYHLEKSVLEQVFRHSLDWDQSLQTIHDLSRFNHDIMNDACGYLQCLIDEYFFLENSNTPDCERLRKNLYGRFSAFDSSYPFRFDHDTPVQKNSNVVFFDNPLLKYMERTLLCSLLVDMERGIEAELLRAQLSHVDHHLPSNVQASLIPVGLRSRRAVDRHIKQKRTSKSAAYRTPMPSPTPSGYRNHPPPFPPPPEPSDVRRDEPSLEARAILQDPNCSDAAVDDIRLSLERLIRQGRDAGRAKDAGKLVDREKALEQERLKLTEDIARFREDIRKAEERTRLTETKSTSLVTLKDPLGREFKLPFHQCRSFAAMQEFMLRVLGSDILAPHIVMGDYEFTRLDGNPITRDSWDSDIQPGETIMFHTKTDLGPTQIQESEKASTELSMEDSKDKEDQARPGVGDGSDSST
ncbi:hypothetical protein AbraIFM66950_010157 [Aspergillus brasiliensis]|nr:hypothetical protein AbraIFM66950_010157 [Aspergillus brasiliensis]